MHKTIQAFKLPNSRTKPVNHNQLSRQLNTASLINHSFRTKPTHCLELEIFKQQLRNSFHRTHCYNFYNRRVGTYRSIFFLLALVFVVLGTILFTQNLFFSGLFLENVKLLIKTGILGCIGLLATLALSAGYFLCVAKEATGELAKNAKRQIARTYAYKRIEYGISGLLFFWNNSSNTEAILRSTYYAMLHAVDVHREETYELLCEILSSTEYEQKDRKLLFSQAMAQYEELLHQETRHFKTMQF